MAAKRTNSSAARERAKRIRAQATKLDELLDKKEKLDGDVRAARAMLREMKARR